jgi:outer membrane protein
MKAREYFPQFFLGLASKKSSLALAIFFIPGLAFSQTLMEAYELAIQNDPKYLAAKAEAGASSTAIDQARAGFLPKIMADFQRKKTEQNVEQSENAIFGEGSARYFSTNNTLSISQPIFRKEVIEQFKQSKAVVKQAEYTLIAAEQDLLMRTVSAYLIVLAAKDSLALATAEQKALGKLVETAKKRREHGLGTITQQDDAEARYAYATAREIEAGSKLRDAYQGLREITGEYFNNVQMLHDDFPLEYPEPNSVDSWLDLAFENNLILLARREGVNVARLEISRQSAGHYPSLALNLNHNYKDEGSTLYGGGSVVDTTEVMLQLKVPIFEGGAVKAATQEAAYRYQKSQEEYEFEHRSLDRRTRAAFDSIVSGVSMIEALNKSVVAQQSALKTKLEGYKSGLNTMLPVLDAQSDLYLAKRDYLQSRYDYLINSLKLKQAVGTLSETDVTYVATKLR